MAGKIPKPKKCISKEEAKELQKNWCNTRSEKLQKKMGFEDARSFWWSLEELEEYLAYVKQESKEQGISNPGIKVHLGAYSPQKCKKNRGYSTVFFVPTGAKAGAIGKDGSGDPINYDIQPFNYGNHDDPPNDY